jgi:calcineurin-like phosphoesterase family protein
MLVASAVLGTLAPSAAGQAATTTFYPSADSHVQADKPSSNFGLSSGLRVDGSPVSNAYLRFDVTGLTGTVTGATLRVFSRTSSSTGISLRPVASNLWGETTITYANAPPSGAEVAKSAITSGAWASLDARLLVGGNGTVSMAIKTTSSTSRTLDSREGVNRPQLVITTNAAPPANSLPPSISGTASEGETLTAAPGAWNGTEPISYAYRWGRCDAAGANCADIPGAASQTYTLGSSDVGATVRVAVTASNVMGFGTAQSPALAVAAPAGPPVQPLSVQTPTISGATVEGGTLSAEPGIWSGTQPISHAYQWRRCDTADPTCPDIPGATNQSYTLTGSDVGATVRVSVTASNVVGSSQAISDQTAVVTTAPSPVIAAAGDIACDPGSSSFNGGLGTSGSCHQKYTSDLLVGTGAARVLTLGDDQYENGTLTAFGQSYDPTWGRLKSITSPAVGNHEYGTAGAAGYFDYFNGVGNQNGPAGDRTRGYYSFDVGAWHLISLNSNCSRVGGCGAGAPQEQWLRQDLAASGAQCTLAYWHHPLFSSGSYTPGVSSVKPLFQALYDYSADVVLTGHDHNYERFAPQDPAGTLDQARGIREFVVGTGGKSHYQQGVPIANSEVRDSTTYGVLKMTLHPTSYAWQFVSEAGQTFSDSGSEACDGTTNDTVAPTAPTNLTAAALSSNRVDLNWAAATDDVGVIGYEIFRNGSLLSTTTSAVTSYSDTAALPSTSYDYQVKARDAAGNVSTASNTASVTTAAPTTVLTFSPEADARVSESSPGTNYATSYLRGDGGPDPDVESYLRFTVSGVQGTVQSAKLRLYAYSGTADGPAVYKSGNTWSETGITWGTRPARLAGAADDKAAIATNSWIEYNVTPFVAGNGTYTFVLATPSSDGVDIYSREAPNLRPELLLTAG